MVRAHALVAAVFSFVGLVSLQACSSKSNAEPADGTPGGKITVPVGTKCTDDSVCGGGRCVSHGCVPGLACKTDAVCQGAKCVDGGCVPLSASDGKKDGDETDVDCGGTVAPRCDDGKTCSEGTDCGHAVCAGGTCAAPTTTDGVWNGDETDVDCGGGTGVFCAAGKMCEVPLDCDSHFCTNNICEPRQAGRQDGDESDVDCGGTVAPACDWGQRCNVDHDCSSNGCGSDGKCLVGPSCKPVHGGSTCGTGEFNDAGKQHESCCKTLPVSGFSDADHPGKTVYVDKYEITAGRMRAFIESIAAANGGTPDIKGYMTSHRPVRWNPEWETVLPAAYTGSNATYTVSSSLNYPGEDQYNINHPLQTTWQVNGGTYTNDFGVYRALGAANFFDEYYSDPQIWKIYTNNDLDAASHYAATHALNCNNSDGSYGYSTYWFDAATVQTYSGGVGKFFSKDDMDEKALNCTPFAMFAAFCAWDGGQLMTAEVSDAITNNTISPVYYTGGTPFQNGKLAAGNSVCGGNGSLITYTDGAHPCYPYFYPNDMGNTYDGSSRIAPPGRVPADTITKDNGAEPWMDMIGNLQEAVFKGGETQRFDYRGYGAEFGSIQNHRNQQTTARMKGGAFGARCMRFK